MKMFLRNWLETTERFRMLEVIESNSNKSFSTLLILFLILSSSKISAQTDFTNDQKESGLSSLVNFNFLGEKTSWSNFTPGVFYGWNESASVAKNLSWDVSVGPYISTQIKIDDSTAYLPSIMMPGNAGLFINESFKYSIGDHKLIVSPLNFGLKALSGYNDTTSTLLQHNIRFSMGYGFKDLFLISFQYTYGWHNMTSTSEMNFEKLFKNKSTDVNYYNVTLQTRLSDEDSNIGPLYLLLTWRGFGNTGSLGSLPNDKIVSFGFVKTLNFNTGPGAAPADGR